MLLHALTSTLSIPKYPTNCPSQYGVVARLNGLKTVPFWCKRNQRIAISATNDQSSSVKFNAVRKRKVVEHICLLKAKQDLSEEEENDMLDYLFTSQYQMRGIIAISLGPVVSDTCENYSHAVFMRFQRKEDVTKFYENPFYLKVLKEHVMPYCQELINVDYESEVEDDILPIFRKGEEFNYGVEFQHLISFNESAFGAPVEDALTSYEKLTEEFPSLIVQSTRGSNFNPSSKEYTHAIVTRFRSTEAFEMFMESSEYKDMWRSKFELIIRKSLRLHYSVDPVGKELM